MLLRYFHTSSRLGLKNYYEILGIPRNAGVKEIKAAYYEKAKHYHPDLNNLNDKTKTDKFRDISEAYEVLCDDEKRRAYDTTSRQVPHGFYGRPTTRANSHTATGSGPREPVSMNHIHHVYRTLNRLEPEEIPKYRPSEDHNYPGTSFNRFEYARRWDPNANTWVYVKKRDVSSYHRQMQEKERILRLCFMVLMLGAVTFVLVSRSYILYPARPPKRDEPREASKKETMFFWEGRRDA